VIGGPAYRVIGGPAYRVIGGPAYRVIGGPAYRVIVSAENVEVDLEDEIMCAGNVVAETRQRSRRT